MVAIVGDDKDSMVAPDGNNETDAIFDPSTNVVKQSLANHGWTVGVIVTPKKADCKNPKADEQLEIGHVNDDGTIGLFPLFPDGSVNKSKVVMTDQVQLQSTFRAIDVSARLSKWDLSSGAPTIGHDIWVGVAHQALFASTLLRRHCPTGSIYVQKRPTVKVIVASVPSTPFVFTPYPATIAKRKDIGQIHLTVEAEAPVDFNVERPDLEVQQLYEFWRMRRTNDKQFANMHISSVDVVCPLPKVKGLRKSVVVKVPTAVAFTKVAPGDELVLYVPAKEKNKKEADKLLPVLQEPVQKKQRIES